MYVRASDMTYLRTRLPQSHLASTPRLAPAQEEKLRYVASTMQTMLSDFVLASALERADQVLEDRTEPVATDEDFLSVCWRPWTRCLTTKICARRPPLPVDRR